MPWRHPLERATEEAPDAAARARSLAASARPLLLGTALAFGLAAAAEAWRYGLVLRGRTELLGAATVALSDSVVVTAGVLAPVLALLSGVVVVLWLVRTRLAVAELNGVTETRSVRGVVLGAVLPVVNLGQAGVLLTELEHMIARSRPGGRPSHTGEPTHTGEPSHTGVPRRDAGHNREVRPSPSPLVRAWWTAWVMSAGLSVLTWVWRWQGTVQAQADAIVLAGLSDLAAGVSAALTFTVVRRCTAVLVAGRSTPRRWVASLPIGHTAGPGLAR